MANIRVGCATVVEKDGKLLLGTRGKETGYGAIIILGGGVDLYEDFRKTAKREIKKETGIEIKNLKQIGAYQTIVSEKENHRVITYWRTEYRSGEVVASDDLLSAKFYSKEEVESEIKADNLNGVPLEVLKDIG